jgi:hypothetical protein
VQAASHPRISAAEQEGLLQSRVRASWFTSFTSWLCDVGIGPKAGRGLNIDQSALNHLTDQLDSLFLRRARNLNDDTGTVTERLANRRDQGLVSAGASNRSPRGQIS